MSPEQEAYLTLGIEPGASTEEIRRAYRQLALRWHPDVSEEPDANQRFQDISAAYAMLSNPGRKVQQPTDRSPNTAEMLRIDLQLEEERIRKQDPERYLRILEFRETRRRQAERQPTTTWFTKKLNIRRFFRKVGRITDTIDQGENHDQ